jgi:hypothetical protein
VFRLVIAWRGLCVLYGLFILAASISGNQACARGWLALAWCFVETGPRLGRVCGRLGHDPS